MNNSCDLTGLLLLRKVVCMCIFICCSCDLWFECDGKVFYRRLFSYKDEKPSSLLRAPQRPDRHRGYLLSFQKLPNSYLLSSWLPLASLSLLPPTPSLIFSSCFFRLELECQAGVVLRDTSVFESFCFQLCLRADSTRLPGACLSLLHQPPTVTLLCCCYDDLMTEAVSSFECVFV